MLCIQCREFSDDRARFCPNCGASLLPASCPSCGRALPPRARFCPDCGTAAAFGDPGAETPPANAPPPTVPPFAAPTADEPRAAAPPPIAAAPPAPASRPPETAADALLAPRVFDDVEAELDDDDMADPDEELGSPEERELVRRVREDRARAGVRMRTIAMVVGGFVILVVALAMTYWPRLSMIAADIPSGVAAPDTVPGDQVDRRRSADQREATGADRGRSPDQREPLATGSASPAEQREAPATTSPRPTEQREASATGSARPPEPQPEAAASGSARPAEQREASGTGSARPTEQREPSATASARPTEQREPSATGSARPAEQQREAAASGPVRPAEQREGSATGSARPADQGDTSSGASGASDDDRQARSSTSGRAGDGRETPAGRRAGTKAAEADASAGTAIELPSRTARLDTARSRTPTVPPPPMPSPSSAQRPWLAPAALPSAVARRPGVDVRAEVEQAPSPAVAGAVAYRVRLSQPNGEPVSDADVRLRGLMADGGMVEARLDRTETPGAYQALLAFSARGPRQLTLRITRSDSIIEMPLAESPRSSSPAGR